MPDTHQSEFRRRALCRSQSSVGFFHPGLATVCSRKAFVRLFWPRDLSSRSLPETEKEISMKCENAQSVGMA